MSTPANPEQPQVRIIPHAGWSERHVVLSEAPPHDCNACTKPYNGFGNVTFIDRHSFGATPCTGSPKYRHQAPLTALLANPGAPCGLQVETISGVEVTPLRLGNQVIGNYWEDVDARYCMLGAIGPTNLAASRGDQTRQVFHIILNILENLAMTFHDVVRTWFYNDRILDWYGEFNAARTGFFNEVGIHITPASTGIGIANSGGGALMAKVLAIQPKTDRVKICRVDSPLQCEAGNYGSSFSRAMQVTDAFSRVLYISGTASIEPGGATVHVGDTAKQLDKTMEVVEAILKHANMSWADTTRAIAYFRFQKDIPLWQEYVKAKNLPSFPVTLAECDVCRDDLWFELELDAAVTL